MSSPAPSIYHADAILVDSDDTDYDHYFDEGGITSTAASLASQITDYRYENGRRYHAYHGHSGSGSYWAPNDEAQQNQEEIFHLVYTLRLNGELFLAPLDKEAPRLKVLDLGTGNGIWPMDMAHQYPQCEIIGNDLSPIQPTYVPPNVQFEIDDFNDEWVHPQDHFDFIHGRALYGSVTNWDQLLRKVFYTLKPGGWWESVETVVEFQCDDGSLPDDAAVRYWVGIMRIACERAGTSFDVAGRVKDWCEGAGFEEVTQKVFKLPIGPWPKDKYEKALGSYNLANMLSACDGFSLHLLTKYYGMSVEDLENLMNRVKTEMKTKKIHSYFRMYVCYARKPEADPSRDSRPSSRGSTIRPPAYDHSGGETDCASILEEQEEQGDDEDDGDDGDDGGQRGSSGRHGQSGRQRPRAH